MGLKKIVWPSFFRGLVSLRRILRKSFYGKVFISKMHRIQAYIYPKIISDEKSVRHSYKRLTGKDIDLHNPKTFCEKINWYKLNAHNPLMVQCADKLALRTYVTEKGYGDNLNVLLGTFQSISEINPEQLPNRFVLKASHGTHMNIIVHDKTKENWKRNLKLLSCWLYEDIYWRGREWVYKDIPHRIIAEEYLEDESGELRDYKFFCFHGIPYYMQYDIGRLQGKQFRNYYDMSRNMLDISDGTPSLDLEQFPVDDEIFEKMQEMAKCLAKPFQQVRVDFYCCNKKIYVGEMTFFDGGGTTIFTTDEWNYKFSEKWVVEP